MTVAAGKRHQKVGRSEFVVAKVKQLLLSSVQSYVFQDYFDMHHKISLMQLHINERPVFFHNNRVLTPQSLDSALLKRSSSQIKVFTISDFVIPKDKVMKQLVHELSAESREVLNLLASENAKMYC